MGLGFLSTPSARRATFIIYLRSVLRWISIHALREEGDLLSTHAGTSFVQFLSTPSARRATDFGVSESDYIQFLSTPSARRATEA